MKKTTFLKTFLVAIGLLMGTSAWADPIETVGTDGTGDSWENRKYSTFYNISQGETFHWNFTLTTYDGGGDKQNYYNWLLNVKETTGTATDDWFFTLRADNYGWGNCYSNADNMSNFNWSTFLDDQNGATVDMYVNYSETDQKVRTYVHTTISGGTKTYFYYNTSSAITGTPASVYIALCEQYAKLVINTAEKVTASKPNPMYLYSRTAGAAATYTNAWVADNDVSTSAETGKWRAQGAGTDPVTCTEADGLLLPTATCSYTVTYSNVSPTDGATLTYDVVWGFTTGNRNNNYSSILFGNDIEIQACGQAKEIRLIANGATTKIGATNASRWSDELTIHCVVNTFSKKITTLTVTSRDNSATMNYSSSSDIDIASTATFSNLQLKTNRGQSILSTGGYIKSILVKNEAQDVVAVDYTVKFQDALGTELKADVVHNNGVVGDVYQATAEDMATFYDNADESLATKKYVYNSGQNTSVVASSTAASNVITLVFDVYDKTAYTVNAQAGGSDIKTGIASGTAYLDGSTTAYWSKYVKVSDQWYVADETTYGATITTATTNVAYTAYAANDIYDIIECESTTYNSAGDATGTGYSNGKTVLLASGKTMETKSKIAAGIYDFSVYNTVRRSNDDRLKLQYSTNGTDWTDAATLTFPSNSPATQTAEKVALAEDSYVRFLDDVGQNSCHFYDYILVKKFVSATLGTNNYGTFASTYPLNLSTASLPSGVTAYKASVSGTTVTFTALDQTVPANTGILIKGTGTSVDIPVAASGTTVTDNAFLVNEAGTTFSGDGVYYYFGLLKDSDPLTFAQFAPGTVAIPADKAYLKVLKSSIDASPARGLNVVFEDEATGIEAVKAQNVENGQFFNLAGQRVAQPAKGLYIVNGKKVIVK